MELIPRSIDEITSDLADFFDELIAPKKIKRNNDNKIYLLIRAYARGLKLLNDAALALKYRFHPLYCPSADLYSTAKLVGTDFKQGAGSILKITIRNPDRENQHTLNAGIYQYTSVSGMVFAFNLEEDYRFDPGEYKNISAISAAKGSYHVEDNAGIRLTRQDGAAIDPELRFSCADNIGHLGYPDESEYEFRERIMNDADRQDHLKELELRIRNLPNIFECTLVFNPGFEDALYDNITLAPLELLVVITGAPTNEIARLIVEEVQYQTHMEDPDKVLYYDEPLYVNGSYPVYYVNHRTTEFSLSVMYQYDEQKLKSSQVEEEILFLLDRYTHADTHIDRISEGDIYKALSGLRLPNVKILNAGLISEGSPVPYITIPRTRIPHLTDVEFITPENGGTDAGGEA
jgi:hypothetical protein